MYLNKLTLQNFKKYRRAEINFQDGLTGIVGKNGSGKSTLVEAIAWALYGYRAIKVKNELIKNNLASPREDVVVKLDMMLGSRRLEYYRAMKGKNNTPHATLSIDGNTVASGYKEVDSKTIELLGIGYEDFMKTIYARQKDLDNILKEGGTKKREYLMELLGIDAVKNRVMEYIKKESDSLKEEKMVIDAGISDIGNIEEALRLKSEEHLKARVEFESSIKEAEQKEELVRIKRSELDEENSKQNKYEILLTELGQYKKSLAEKEKLIDREKSEVRSIEECKKRLAELEPEIKRLAEIEREIEEREPRKKEYESLSRKHLSLTGDLKHQQASLGEKADMLEARQRDKRELEKLQPDEEKYRRLESELPDLEKKKELYNDLSGRFLSEERGCREIEKNIANLQSEIRGLEDKKARLQEIEPLKKEYDELVRQLERFREAKSKQDQILNLQNDKTKVEKDIHNLKVAIEDIELKLSGIGNLEASESEIKAEEKRYEILEKKCIDEISDLNGNLKACLFRIKENKKHLSAIKNLGKDSNCPTCERKLEDQYGVLVRKYESSIAADGRTKNEMESEIMRAETELSRLRELKADLKKQMETVAEKKNWRTGMLSSKQGLDARINDFGKRLNDIIEVIARIGDTEYDPEAHREADNRLKQLENYVIEYNKLKVQISDIPLKTEKLEGLLSQKQNLVHSIEKLKEEIKLTGHDEKVYQNNKKSLDALKPVHAEYGRLKDRIRDIPSLSEAVVSIRQKISDLNGEIARVRDSMYKSGFDPAMFESLQSERKKLKPIENETRGLELKIAAEDGVRMRLKEAELMKAEIADKLNKKQKDILDLGYDSGRHESVKKQVKDSEAALNEAKDRSRQVLTGLKIIESALSEIGQKIEKKKKFEKRLDEIGHRQQVVSVSQNLFNRFFDHILVKIRDDIAINAGRILDDVTGKYSIIAIDDDFNIKVEDAGDLYPVGRYSGGEMDDIALAVRIAISEYIMRFSRNRSEFSFLIMDEVFGSQDIERREGIINMLRGLDQRFAQVLVITHIGDVHDQFDNFITVVEGNDGFSRVEVREG